MKKGKFSVKFQMMAVKDIKPNSKNPRIIKDTNFRKLVKSLQDFPEMLQIRPIVIDEKNMVIGGNQRLKAAIELKWKEVPVVYAENLTNEQKKEFIVRDNIPFGDWDDDILVKDWDTSLLNDWGLSFSTFKGFQSSEEKQLTGYKKVHVLISFDPNDFYLVQSLLEEIKQTGVVDYEQGAN